MKPPVGLPEQIMAEGDPSSPLCNPRAACAYLSLHLAGAARRDLILSGTERSPVRMAIAENPQVDKAGARPPPRMELQSPIALTTSLFIFQVGASCTDVSQCVQSSPLVNVWRP